MSERRGVAAVVVDTTAGSFDDFYRAHLVPAVRQAALITGSVAGAEDVVHDAMVGLFQRWGDVREPAAYLRRSVVNGAVRWGGRRRREPSLAEVPERAVPVAPSLADLLRDLAELPVRQRAAVVLRYHDGLTEHEIAEVLGCRPGSVGPLLTRARRTLEGRWST